MCKLTGKCGVVLLIALIFWVGNSFCRANSVTLQAGVNGYTNTPSGSTDTWIRSDNTSSTNGTNATLLVGQVGGGGDLSIYLSFNLSSIPQNAQINSGSLNLVISGQDTGSETTSLKVDLFSTGSFVASTLDYAHRPNEGALLSSFLATSNSMVTANTQTFTSSSAFVTALQTARSNGDATAYFEVRLDNEAFNTNRHILDFYSNESSFPQNFPFLTLDYSPVPEPTTALAGGLAMLGSAIEICRRTKRRLRLSCRI